MLMISRYREGYLACHEQMQQHALSRVGQVGRHGSTSSKPNPPHRISCT